MSFALNLYMHIYTRAMTENNIDNIMGVFYSQFVIHNIYFLR